MALSRPATLALGTLALPAMAFGISAAAATAGNSVTEVSAQARPAEYRGECPAALEFVGTIKVSAHPVVVEYVWERSNHSRSQVRRIEVRGSVQTVTVDNLPAVNDGEFPLHRNLPYASKRHRTDSFSTG